VGRKETLGSDGGELEIEATSDRTGHITLLFCIPHNYAMPWSAQARVLVEAGQIERLANAAEAFFGRRAV
jgi:Family of unknown function (DUF6228)